MDRRTLVFVCLLVASCSPPPASESDSVEEGAPARADPPRGLRARTLHVSPGFVLFSPLLSDTTYLIDNDGTVVHTWKSSYAYSGKVRNRTAHRRIRWASLLTPCSARRGSRRITLRSRGESSLHSIHSPPRLPPTI